MRIRLDLRYDGTLFYGWAKQPNFRTIQEELELALSKVLPGQWGTPVPTIVAGRTDTGVHASHQVVHFDYSSLDDDDFDFDVLLRRLLAVLPEDIVVYRAIQVPDDFSARFWAKSRTYKYKICDSVQHLNPNRRSDVLFWKNPLDVRKMNRAVRKFTGLHDFAAFSKPRQGATTTRNLHYFRFKRKLFGHDKGLIVATLKADAFAYNMVRSLVGASIMVGSGQRDVNWMQMCLERQTREGATGPTAAKGLTLEHVQYINNPKQASQRAKLIKNRRTP
jgi:tRNA pseudouridine38-40 synthase